MSSLLLYVNSASCLTILKFTLLFLVFYAVLRLPRSEAMAVGSLLFLAVLVIVHHPPRVSDKQDLATVQRAQQQEQRLALEMTHLELEFEQRNQAKRPGPHQSLGPNQSQGKKGPNTWPGMGGPVRSWLFS
ncbi:inositol 1,4,5-trisphosphate receptor-interacting protein-like 1 [Mauremys reevesii]|uniref:inositol 1,4,5-trisphosphate receptor-interacting protein-like 1 n=1 Tax=Mauremys reevesii TaxID=260615 RepID=UPI00193F1171|nr:inositol 1,4,5-trisphosphate receptor-interacting protein-like 1 [Mauremys reevesii]